MPASSRESREATGERREGSTQDRARRCLVLLVAATVLWGGLYIYRTSFVSEGERYFCLWDDAMITMRYARNLREGHGLVWNPGERVLGISNPGVALVMAAIHTLPLPPSKLALVFQLLNLLIVALCLLLVWRIAERLFPESPWISVGAVLLTALCGPLTVWSLQGSDVGFVSLWILTGVAMLTSTQRWPQWTFPLLCAGLFIRIDGALFFATFLAISLLYPGGRVGRLLRGGVLLVALLGAGMGLCWLYYGEPLPNTYYLKATGSPRSAVLAAGLRDLIATLPGLAVPIALASIAAWKSRREPAALACAALFLAALTYNFWVGADWVHGHVSRFLAPGLPPLLILTSAGGWRFFRRVLPEKAAPAALLACLAVVGVFVNPAQGRSDWLNPTSTPLYRSMSHRLVRFAQYLVRHSDSSTTIGAGWAGIAPYFSGRPAIDTLGKSDRHIAHLEVSNFVSGHSKSDWHYVINTRTPDVFFRVYESASGRPDFQREYDLMVLPELWFFVRKSSVHRLHEVGNRFSLPLEGEDYRVAVRMIAQTERLYKKGVRFPAKQRGARKSKASRLRVE